MIFIIDHNDNDDDDDDNNNTNNNNIHGLLKTKIIILLSRKL